MSMYPSLHEHQGLAQEAVSDSVSANRSSLNSDATMNGTRQTAPSAPPPYSYHVSSSRSRRPLSNDLAPMYCNGAYYPSERVYEGRDRWPSQLSVRYITHLYYAYAAVDYDGTVRLADERADLEVEVDGHKGAIAACLALKQRNPNLKVILSIGGPKASDAFPYAAADPFRRQFASSLRSLVKRLQMDGADIVWQFPQDHAQGVLLMELLNYLRGYLPQDEGFHLSVALPAALWALERLEVKQLKFCPLDCINLMAYDFCGFTKTSGHHAQLLANTLPGTQNDWPSSQSAFNYLIHAGCPASRLVLGIPCYGKAFVGAGGPNERYTDTRMIPYRELAGANVTAEVDGTVVGAHHVSNNAWVSYDNAETVERKARFVMMQRGGGLFYCEATADLQTTASSLILAGFETLRGG